MEKNDSAGALSKAEPCSSHRLHDFQALAGADERLGGVLRAAVGVEDHPSRVSSAGGHCHVDSGLGEFGSGIGVAEGGARHSPGEQVLDGGEVDGAFLGGNRV